MSGWVVLALCLLASACVFVAFLPMLCVILEQEQRDKEMLERNLGGSNYVE